MNAADIFVFPDTNVFEQCRDLNELAFCEVLNADSLKIIVARAIQEEIDRHKRDANPRRAKRARKAAALFHKALSSENETLLVRESGPRIALTFPEGSVRRESFPVELDPDRTDDRLVAEASSFRAKGRVILLTHDTGVMLTAKRAGLEYIQVPDSWLLPPESTDAEKRIKELEAEVARLRETEPDFRIRCVDRDGAEKERIEIEVPRYLPLTEEEVSGFMRRIADRFPMASDFGPQKPGERVPQFQTTIERLAFGFTNEVFVPATDEEISSYKNKRYPEWIDGCERNLRQYHNLLEQRVARPMFIFSVTNGGIRPAKDALITLESKGPFEVMPPRRSEKEDDENKSLGLGRPPRPPQGMWERRNSVLQAFESMGALRSYSSPLSALRIPPLHSRRDPNAFYWKPSRPEIPASGFSLECEQWRHGVDAELFEVELYFDKTQMSVSGLLECRIHAENLSQVVALGVPVRIKISEVRAYETVSAIVEALVRA
jgi:hypothetical protein